MKIVLATRNAHKVRELKALLRSSPIEWLTLAGFPGLPEVKEDKRTLEGNARKKAVETAKKTGHWTLAEDTGLEVPALGGAPGVYSARYAGPGCRFEDNNRKLLKELSGVKGRRRRAVFRTVMALSDPRGRVVLEEGRLPGTIGERPRGSNGFGYDPLFCLPAEGKTLAQLSAAKKNMISHRSRALKKMLPRLKALVLPLLLLAAPMLRVEAGRTEPGQDTIWDQIMASQANRGLQSGSRYMDLKQYDQAVKEFSRAVMANPKDAAAHMMLGAAYYWVGKVDLALEEYQTSLDLDPKNAQTWMLIGIARAWKGQARGSYEAFQKAAEFDSTRADIQMNLGSIEETMGLTSEALKHFRKAVALDPRHPLYHFQLGMLYRRLGRDTDAVTSMRKALKRMANFEDALLELGAAQERLGDSNDAIHSFKKAVALKSRDSVARFRLGRLYLLAGNKDLARNVFEEAFHLTPEGDEGGLKLSVSYTGGVKKAAAKAPTEGEPEKQPQDPNDPLSVLQRNLERIPLEQNAIMRVDVAFVPRPKLEKAAASEAPSSLKSALARGMKPKTREGSPRLTRREYPIKTAGPEGRGEQIKQIVNDLRGVMKTAGPDSDVRLGMNLNYTSLADAVPKRSEAEGAPKASYQPRRVGNDLDLWVMGTGWMALVEEMLPEQGDRPKHPNDPDWWVCTGLGYAAIGDGQRALAAFEAANRMEPRHELSLLGRGVASVMTGNDAAAIAAYEEVLRINPQNRPAREGLKWLKRSSPQESK